MNLVDRPELDWLSHALLLSLALGLLVSLVVGLLMLLRPNWLFAINDRWSRWVDTSGTFGELDRPRSLERTFYRHHRLAGALVTLASGYVLWQWMFAYRREGVFAMLGDRWRHSELNWIVSAGEVVVVLAHLFILVIGLVIFARPSLLKFVEEGGNRWHEANLAKDLDRVYSPLERLLQVNPRVAGLILLLAASWCLSGIVPVLERTLR